MTFLPLLVFALIAAGVAGYGIMQVAQELVLQRQTALTQVAAAGVAADLKSYVRLLQSVASEMAENAGRLPQQQEILAERTRLLGRFTAGTTLLDVRGTAVAVTEGQQAVLGLNYAFRPYFQEVRATHAPAFSTVIQNPSEGFDAVVIAVPVMSARRTDTPGGPEFAGVLIGEFALERPEWADELNLLRTPQGGQAYLLDNRGTIIFHPDHSLIGTRVREDSPLRPLIEQGHARSTIVQSEGGVPVISSMAPVPGISWLVATDEPWDAVRAPLTQYQWVAGGLWGLGVLLGGVALVLTARRVTGPLQTLLAEGKRVAAGEPFRALPVTGPSDVRATMLAVNQMVVRLGEQGAALRNYAARIVEAQEEERRRLARDLHDGTVQQLVGLAQRIELCSDSIDEDPAAAREQLQLIQTQAYATADEVRRMSNSLRPSVLEDLGLAAALNLLARSLGKQLPETQVTCQVVGKDRRLPRDAELALYRIAQEALNNVGKHAASARHINVALYYEDWGIQLMVEDDGPGFDLTHAETVLSPKHLGLAGMRERAHLIGGKLAIKSELGEGTVVSLKIKIDVSNLQMET
jgi:two-component system sensor histidine kinase UhpB